MITFEEIPKQVFSNEKQFLYSDRNVVSETSHRQLEIISLLHRLE